MKAIAYIPLMLLTSAAASIVHAQSDIERADAAMEFLKTACVAGERFTLNRGVGAEVTIKELKGGGEYNVDIKDLKGYVEGLDKDPSLSVTNAEKIRVCFEPHNQHIVNMLLGLDVSPEKDSAKESDDKLGIIVDDFVYGQQFVVPGNTTAKISAKRDAHYEQRYTIYRVEEGGDYQLLGIFNERKNIQLKESSKETSYIVVGEHYNDGWVASASRLKKKRRSIHIEFEDSGMDAREETDESFDLRVIVNLIR